MSEKFEKGQLVAVRDHEPQEWQLRMFDSMSPGGQAFCRRIPYGVEPKMWWNQIKPAEEVWPEIFLGQHRNNEWAYMKALDKLNAQIEWLCSNLAGALNEGKLCPPSARCDGNVECEDCWSFAAEIATEKDAEHADEEESNP